MGDAAIAVAAQHLRDGDVIAADPAALQVLGGAVQRVLDELLQRLQRLPVVDGRDQPARRVLPGLLAQIA